LATSSTVSFFFSLSFFNTSPNFIAYLLSSPRQITT
jgi:hypothetical protein